MSKGLAILRNTLLLALVLVSVGGVFVNLAAAQEALQVPEQQRKKEYLGEYFARCMGVPAPDQDYDSHGNMCMCQAAHMPSALTADEMQVMATGEGKTKIRRKKLFLDVYAPCMEFPVRSIALQNCYDDQTVRAVVSTQNAYEGACKCVASAMGKYARDYGRPQLAVMLINNDLLEDYVGAIMDSFDYKMELSDAQNKCLNKYQAIWENQYREPAERKVQNGILITR